MEHRVQPRWPWIVSSNLDNTLYVWPAPRGLGDELCAKLTRNRSHRQWHASLRNDDIR